MTKTAVITGTIHSTRRHNWRDAQQREIAACDSPDGCNRIEKTCPVCSIVRITVMPPYGVPYHKWRHAKARAEIPLSNVPPCVEAKK